MTDPIPMKEAIQKGYHPCLDLDLLCEIYGCNAMEDLSVLLGQGQNLIYYDKWHWNIAYESAPCRGDTGWYGNPFYDMFSSEGGYQWMSQQSGRFRKQPAEREDSDWTPEELIRIMNAFTEIMEWRNMPDHSKTLSKMSKLVFEGADTPQQGQQFQDFLKDRKKVLVLQGKW
jgi:hypothetical protein